MGMTEKVEAAQIATLAALGKLVGDVRPTGVGTCVGPDEWIFQNVRGASAEDFVRFVAERAPHDVRLQGIGMLRGGGITPVFGERPGIGFLHDSFAGDSAIRADVATFVPRPREVV